MSKMKSSKYALVVQEMPTRESFISLLGATFGRLTVTSYAGKRGKHQMWNCLCACGSQVVTSTNALNRGNTSSCGCLRKQTAATQGSLNCTHGQAIHGMESGNYQLWRGIKIRAVNGYKCDKRGYSRGIGMHPKWVDDFAEFDAWISANLGDCPKGCSLDRIDNGGDYEPGNISRATNREQARNR